MHLILPVQRSKQHTRGVLNVDKLVQFLVNLHHLVLVGDRLCDVVFALTHGNESVKTARHLGKTSNDSLHLDQVSPHAKLP